MIQINQKLVLDHQNTWNSVKSLKGNQSLIVNNFENFFTSIVSLAQGYPSAVDAINTKDMYSRLILFFNYGWWLVAGLIGNTTNSAQCWWLVAGLIGNITN